MPSKPRMAVFGAPLLGQTLMRRNLISVADLDRALALQAVLKKPLGAVLVEIGALTPEELGTAVTVEPRDLPLYGSRAMLERLEREHPQGEHAG